MTTIFIGWVFALLSTLGQSPSDEPTLSLKLSLGTAAPPQMEEVLRGQFLGFGIAFSNRTAQRLEREHNAAGYTLPDEARVVLRAEGDERPWSAVVEARLVQVGGDEAAEVVLPEAYFDREFDARWPAPVGTTVGGSPVTFPVYVSPEDSALLEPGEYEFRVRFELPGVGGAHLETPHLDAVHSFTLEEPDDPQHELAILQSRAVYHLWFGQPEVAAAAAEAILAADPSFGGGSAYSLAADAYEKGEDPANAIRILELSMSRLPDSATDVRAAVEQRIAKLRARQEASAAPLEK